MYSILLRIVAGYFLPIFLFFALFTLFRGHNSPGGGFIGGLLAASAFILYAIAFDRKAAQKKLRVPPVSLLAAGLLISTVSGIPALGIGLPFLKGLWIHFHLPVLGDIHLGTPLLFDAGVFLTVIGITTSIIFTLLGEE